MEKYMPFKVSQGDTLYGAEAPNFLSIHYSGE